MERLLQRDMVLRILSLVLAIVLWVLVTGEQSPAAKSQSMEIPVQHNLPGDLQLVEGSIPDKVRVTLTVPTGAAVPKELRAFVDFSGADVGRHVLMPVVVQDLPPGVTAAVQPPEISVLLERMVAREVEVALDPVARDQLIDDVQYRLQPTRRQVKVSGRESLVSQVARAEIIPDLSGIQETGSKEMRVKAVDAAGKEVPGVIVQPDHVAVQVAVHPLPPAKEVVVKPRFMGTLPDGYTFTYTVQPPTVKVRGPRSYHSQWAEVTTEPISLIGQTQSFTVQAILLKPQGAEMLDQETGTVGITIQETSIEQNLEHLPLQVWNLAGNLKADLPLKEVTVRVRGFKRVLDNLDPATLQPHLNLEEKGPGTYTLPVEVISPGEGIEVIGVFPGQAEITVSQSEPAETGPPTGKPGAIP